LADLLGVVADLVLQIRSPSLGFVIGRLSEIEVDEFLFDWRFRRDLAKSKVVVLEGQIVLLVSMDEIGGFGGAWGEDGLNPQMYLILARDIQVCGSGVAWEVHRHCRRASFF
jgi:hypothetical protein